MDLQEVQQVVEETVQNLPQEFSSQLDNVGIVVEPWPTLEEFESIKQHPSSSLLFGLYRGVPKPKRSAHYLALPDKITIYAGPILMTSQSLDDAKQRIQKTVLHEIGHHFGLNDFQLRQRGY